MSEKVIPNSGECLKDCCVAAVDKYKEGEQKARSARERRKSTIFLCMMTIMFTLSTFLWRNDVWDTYSVVVAGLALLGWSVLLHDLYKWMKERHNGGKGTVSE